MAVYFQAILCSLYFLLVGCGQKESTGGDSTGGSLTAKYKLVEAFPALSFETPVELVSPDDGSKRLFIVEQKGVIKVFPFSQTTGGTKTFLDISSKVASGGEMGLLGLAFHPSYKSNGYFYVNYTTGSSLETVISRFKASGSNPDLADLSSETVLLRYAQSYSNHNGGKLAFGNDGFLYIAAGDGGSGGDPGNRAQNKKELLGKILRIDVDRTNGAVNYAIPNDNPFRNNTDGSREEIFAYGMRNPWRFSFDKQTGLLWAGDVGQNQVEEIDIIEKGGNYGWRLMEGPECYSSGCDSSGLKSPVWSYRQGSETGRSVTGGYVCRDKSVPALAGKYLYGDYVSGNIWALTFSGMKAVRNELVTKLSGGLSSFGEDGDGNLYVLAYSSGKVFRLAGE